MEKRKEWYNIPMIIFFIIGLLLGAVAVVFAFQNSEMVAVTLFSWQVEASLSVILVLSVLTGILIALLLTLPEFFNNYFEYRALKKRSTILEEDLRKQRELTVFARKTTPTGQDITHIEETATVHERI